MNIKEEIKNTYQKFTNEELKKINYYLSKDNLFELKEMAREKTKDKFVKVMRLNITKFINQLDNNVDVKKETINLLIQSKNTLNNVHKLIKNKSIVDANSLLRSSLENLIMAMMINYDNNIYNEFLNLSVNDETRKYTKPQYLRNHFRKILRQFDDGFFSDISNRNLKEMLDEFYNKLCLFTHSTLIVNAMVKLQKNENIDIYIFALKQNSYFLEIILYLCLKHLNSSQNQQINILYIVIGWFVLLTDINKQALTAENIEKLKQLLYMDINKEYFEKSYDIVEALKNEIKGFKSELESNPMIIIEVINEIIT